MKILIKSNTILSARGKPSNLTIKSKSHKYTETYRSSALDKYDTGDYGDAGTYEKEESYTDYNGTGSIKDKQGNSYDVNYRTRFDSTSLPFGTTYHYITINYNGEKIDLDSYTGERGSGKSIVSDIEDGIYLEDYLQKHKWRIDSKSRALAEQITEGNESKGTTYKQDREASIAERYLTHKDFGDYGLMLRYIIEVDGDSFILLNDRERKHKDGRSIPEGAILDIDVSKYVDAIGENLEDLDGAIVSTGNGALQYDTKNNTIQQTDYKNGKYVVRKDDTTLYLDALGDGQRPDTSTSKYGSVTLMTYIKRRYQPTVKIVPENDRWNARLRAQGNDGINGPGWVTFPEALRQKGAEYRVDELIWNGKSYRIKGTPKLIER